MIRTRSAVNKCGDHEHTRSAHRSCDARGAHRSQDRGTPHAERTCRPLAALEVLHLRARTRHCACASPGLYGHREGLEDRACAALRADPYEIAEGGGSTAIERPVLSCMGTLFRISVGESVSIAATSWRCCGKDAHHDEPVITTLMSVRLFAAVAAPSVMPLCEIARPVRSGSQSEQAPGSRDAWHGGLYLLLPKRCIAAREVFPDFACRQVELLRDLPVVEPTRNVKNDGIALR